MPMGGDRPGATRLRGEPNAVATRALQGQALAQPARGAPGCMRCRNWSCDGPMPAPRLIQIKTTRAAGGYRSPVAMSAA